MAPRTKKSKKARLTKPPSSKRQRLANVIIEAFQAEPIDPSMPLSHSARKVQWEIAQEVADLFYDDNRKDVAGVLKGMARDRDHEAAIEATKQRVESRKKSLEAEMRNGAEG